MKDINGYDVQIQKLMTCLKINEKVPIDRFAMDNWCGTKSCLWGNYGLKTDLYLEKENDWKNPYFRRWSDVRWDGTDPAKHFTIIAEHFGMSVSEVLFIFGPNIEENNAWFRHIFKYRFIRNHGDKKRALKRLRKYLYYKMRKAELFEDLESARKMSDTGIVKEASELVVSG